MRNLIGETEDDMSEHRYEVVEDCQVEMTETEMEAVLQVSVPENTMSFTTTGRGKAMTATDSQILGYIGIFCIHTKSAPCGECAKVLPDQLRPDKRAEFDRIKQAVAENPYWPEIPPGLRNELGLWSGYGT